MPVSRAAGNPIPCGGAVDLARAYVDRLGIQDLYIADIDAIQGRGPQHDLVSRLSGIGAPLMVDGGVRSVEDALRLVEAGASRVVVGLETLPSFDMLGEISGSVGADRVAFSLDLENGAPILPDSLLESAPDPRPAALAKRAALHEIGALVLIDLARVGMGRGVDPLLTAEIRRAVPGLTLVAGGGVRDIDDLVEIARAGCDGALVATALQSGAIRRTDLEGIP